VASIVDEQRQQQLQPQQQRQRWKLPFTFPTGRRFDFGVNFSNESFSTKKLFCGVASLETKKKKKKNSVISSYLNGQCST